MLYFFSSLLEHTELKMLSIWYQKTKNVSIHAYFYSVFFFKMLLLFYFCF